LKIFPNRPQIYFYYKLFYAIILVAQESKNKFIGEFDYENEKLVKDNSCIRVGCCNW